MKLRKHHMVIILILGTVKLGISQQVKQVELNFDKNDFQLVDTEKQTFRVETSEPAYYYIQESGQPAIPVRSIRVLVPSGAVLEDINYEFDEKLISKEIDISTIAAPVPTMPWTGEQEGPLTYHGSFGDQPVVFQSAFTSRGITWFSFLVSPFRYDGESGQLSFVSSIKLEVKYKLNEETRVVIRRENLTAQNLANELLNPEDLDLYYPRVQTGQIKSIGTNKRVDYLLITSEKMKNGFTPLIHWKFRKGLKVKVVTIEEIESAYEEETLQLKIKRCIYDHYVNAGLTWVLLGGDDKVVPAQHCYGFVDFGTGVVIDQIIPTDLFYACFDRRFDWNANQNEKVGQLYFDDLDLVPEVYLSRIPVKNMAEASVFVQKTIKYETEGESGDAAGKLLLSGVKSWSQWEGKSDNHHRSEFIFDQIIPRFWSGKKIGFYDTGTDFPEDQEYQVTSSNLITLLNEGAGAFHFAGHGNRNSILMEQGEGFNTTDALSLTNPYIGVMLTTVCDAGAYDLEDPSLSEALLGNSNGGIMSFFGSTRLGFGNPNETMFLGPSFRFNSSFIKHLYMNGEGIRNNAFAYIAALAKSEQIDIGAAAGGAYQYLQYAINPMGDPEMQLYSRIPDHFNNVRISRFENTLSVNTGGVSGSTICLTSLNLDEEYQEVSESVTYHVFEDIPEDFQVTITAPDRIPYRYVSGKATGVYDDLSRYIRCYPNPVDDFLQIDMDLSKAKLELFNLQGMLLLSAELSNGTNSISMSAYPDGVYLVKILTDQGNARLKLYKNSTR